MSNNNTNDYNIEKPKIKDGKWLVFPNSIFSSLDTSDCNDAIEGVCYTDKTFNQCVEMCSDHPDCEYGYYISNYNKNTCVPLRNLKSNSNPMYRLRSKNIYPELKNSVTKTFINKKKYPFPPEEANSVFFMDHFTI